MKGSRKVGGAGKGKRKDVSRFLNSADPSRSLEQAIDHAERKRRFFCLRFRRAYDTAYGSAYDSDSDSNSVASGNQQS